MLSLVGRTLNLIGAVTGIASMVDAEPVREAARHKDPVEHSSALAGALIGAAIGAAVVLTGGAFGIAAAGIIAVCGGISTGGFLGQMIGESLTRETGKIKAPCADRVYIYGEKAARSAGEGGVGGDKVDCAGQPLGMYSHPHRVIAEGSATVFIEGLPAARKGDRIGCGAKIAQGSPSVFIWGGTEQYAPIDREVPLLVEGGLAVLGLAGIIKWAAAKLLSTYAPRLLERIPWPKGCRIGQQRGICLKDPVEVASGRVFASHADFELPGRTTIEFTRTYDSSAIDYEGPLGRGWTHSYDIHLWVDDEQEMVILRDEEAVLSGFNLVAVGERAFNPLNQRWLERSDDKVYVVCGQDRLRYKFESVEAPDVATKIEDEPDGSLEAAALKLTEIEDINGNRIELCYEGGRLISLEDSAGTRLNFSYITLDNGTERLAAVSLALGQDAARPARLVNFTYDAEGCLINATDRGLVPRRYAYDEYLLIRHTNRNGLSFHYDYEGEGKEARCVHTWGDRGIFEGWFEYHPEEMMTVSEDSLGRITTYYFNEFDLPVRIIDPMGGVKSYSYGTNGELLSETDEIGRTTKYEYSDKLDCVCIIYPDGTKRRFEYSEDSLPQKLIDESGAEFRRVYDQRGNLTATIDALGNRYRYSYNQFGDPEKAVDPLGGETRFKWNEHGHILEWTTPLGATTRYDYDERGRLIRVSNPLGNATRYAYDALDRLTQVERPDGARHHYGYDPEGNLTNFLDANGAETRFRYVDYNELGERIDALGYTRRFVYDTESNLIEVRNERGEAYRFGYDGLDRVIREVGFDGLTWDYDYDPASQLVARTDPAGRITRFIRDPNGQVLEKQRPDGSVINFNYDIVGRLTEADGPGSELVFKYDAHGQVIRESQNGQVIEHEYDALGRRIKRLSPSGQTVEFTYDADSQLSRLQTPRGSMEFEYDKAGQLTKRRLQGDLEESFHYDRCGCLIEQSLYKPSHTLVHRGYKYDAEGNLIELSDSKKGISRFAYDPVERLREVSQPGKRVEQFVYDSTGNLLRRGERTFRYGQPDRLTKTDDAMLVYDEVGNLIEKRRVGSTIRYSYDPDNQLIAVKSKEGGRVEFCYDVFGRRIAKKTKDGETGFLWDGDVLLVEQRDDKSNEYIFKPDSFEPLCRFDESVEETYHNDHLGTPQTLTDERGRVVWSGSYDVYGRFSQLTGYDAENQIRFQGQYEDVETGLYYNRFRYFDPDTGRYLSQDPIGLKAGTNFYIYSCDPVNWVDPLGLSRKSGEKFERFTDKAEAEDIKRNWEQRENTNNKVLSNLMNDRKAKWIADRNAKPTPQKKHHTHRINIEAEPGTRDWLQKNADTQSDYDNRFGIPSKKLQEFNEKITDIKIKVLKMKTKKQTRKGKGKC
jgi:RHS repeat-associated protein